MVQLGQGFFRSEQVLQAVSLMEQPQSFILSDTMVHRRLDQALRGGISNLTLSSMVKQLDFLELRSLSIELIHVCY